MKFYRLFAVAFALAVFNACAQTTPKVITVPPDELTRAPSLAPATETSPGAPIPAKLVPPTPSAPAKDSYTKANVSGPYIALTFDDGPDPKNTPRLLDMLKERGVRATFYLIGRNVAAHPEIVRRMAAEGHELGNHSWSHPPLTKCSASKLASELNDTSEAIAAAAGSKPATMRPPYGATNASLNRRINSEFGMKVILWSVDPLDWKNRNSAKVASHIIEKTGPGDIILAHDIHATTVDAMPRVLDTLLAKGFQFVTVSELLAMDQPTEVARQNVPPATPAAN